MYAFNTPLLLRHIPQTPKARICPRIRLCAAGDLDEAITSGEGLRAKLAANQTSRLDKAASTAEALNEMSAQIAQITAKLRADAGMPPVAEPPVEAVKTVEKDSEEEQVGIIEEEGASSGGDEPYMDPMNFGYESTAGWQVLAAEDELPESVGGNVEFRIECDMHGCSIIQVKGEKGGGGGVRERFVVRGNGFRVGYDPEAPKSFCGMVGNDQWLLALNYDEIRHFKRLCGSLAKKMDRIGNGEDEMPVKKPALRRSGDGMFNMRVARAGLDCSIELESKLVWVQAMGQPVLGQWCIRAIFMESRQSEGFWSMDTVPDLLKAVSNLGIE